MCGRYVLALRPSEVRQQLQNANMAVDDAPDDDSVRQTYNFAPGYHGLVYRADGADGQPATPESPRYRLQAMKWGLVPFWTKRNPDYGSLLKTINCRDDSLLTDSGMWTSMKKKKRCIVVAQGFYEWLKKNNGKDRLPYFTKRRDGQLMCFAGLWDCVQYEDSGETYYTYAIITTDSNKQLGFLHDRMPVILENGSEAVRTWLDPSRTEWGADLQSLLKPFQGELECYPVSKDVGKVGNNSPSFVVPIDSAANKQNIANFFGSPKTKAPKKEAGVEHIADEDRETSDRIKHTEDNAPLPVPAVGTANPGDEVTSTGIKRERSEGGGQDPAADAPASKRRATADAASQSSPRRGAGQAKKGTRSATSNGSAAKKASKGDGSRKITSFFTR